MKLTKPQLRLIVKRCKGHLTAEERTQMRALRLLIEDFLATGKKA